MSETGPMWLTREEDVVSHLYFAAAEIGSATMEFGSFQVPGSLSFPNPETSTFSFFTHGEVDISKTPIKEGDVVHCHAKVKDLHSLRTSRIRTPVGDGRLSSER